MATAGRPPKKLDHVEGLQGTEEEKRRLRVALETLTGDLTVREACRQLGVSEARFHELRREALQGALDRLAPGQAGRPRRLEPASERRIRELETLVRELEMDLRTEEVRAEIALVMPETLRRKKNGVRAKARRRKHRR